MFAEALHKGLAAGGWVIGLVASVGAFLVFVGLIVLTLTWLVGDKDKEEK